MRRGLLEFNQVRSWSIPFCPSLCRRILCPPPRPRRHCPLLALAPSPPSPSPPVTTGGRRRDFSRPPTQFSYNLRAADQLWDITIYFSATLETQATHLFGHEISHNQ